MHALPATTRMLARPLAAGLCVLAILAGPGQAARRPGSLPRGIAWRDSIQARLDARQWAAADSLASRARAESEADSGAGNPSAARLIRLQGVLESRRPGGSLALALERFGEASRVLERRLGSDHAEVVDLLLTQGVTRARMGGIDEGVALARQGLALAERRAPDDIAALQRPLEVLGTLLGHAGEDREAHDTFVRLARLQERRQSPDTLKLALAWVEVAQAALQIRELSEAEAVLDRIEPWLEARLPARHPDRLRAEGIRIAALRRRGDLAELRVRLDRMIAELEADGRDPATLGRRLRERGHVRSELNDDEGARDDFARALVALEGAPGAAAPIRVTTLATLAQFEDILGRRSSADSLFRRAADAARQLDGGRGASSAFVESARAARAYARGERPAAREGFERVIALYDSAGERASLDRANARLELMRVTADLGLPDTTSALAALVRPVFLRSYGPDHPALGDVTGQEAWANAAAGRDGAAWDLALQASAHHLRHQRLVEWALSENDALTYVERRWYRLAIALAVAGARGTSDADADVIRRDETWEQLVAARGAVQEEVARRRRLRAGGGTPALQAADRAWTLASDRFARLLAQGVAPGDSTHAAELERARDAMIEGERAFAEAAGFARPRESAGGTWLPRLRGRLVAGETLVGFARHAGVPAHPSAYVAFVLRGGRERAEVVTLGRAEAVDSLVQRWRATFDVSGARAAGDRAALEREANATGAALRAKVWDPIARRVGRVTRAYLVPDGELQLVNFAALPDGRGDWLVRTGPEFAVLSSERDLVEERDGPAAPEGLLAVGAVDFDASDGDAPPLASATFRGEAPACPSFRELRFARLPATAEEVNAVAALWPASAGGGRVLAGRAADEGTFKREAPRHRALHLATHGFFLREACAGAVPGERGIGGLAPVASAEPPSHRAVSLRLSGLALAGANQRAIAGPDREDGILTAEEISALDLSGVDRVVLSACHSGVGDVITGQGVTGLRRAFHVAGARTLVMSLWSVDDRASAEWMRGLYAAWASGANTSHAVRRASLDRLDALRRAGASTHPFYWGAFVAVGGR